jgi:hypothetical protein
VQVFRVTAGGGAGPISLDLRDRGADVGNERVPARACARMAGATNF